MKKDTVDLMNWLGLRVGDVIKVHWGLSYSILKVCYDPAMYYVDCITMSDFSAPRIPLNALIGFEIEIRDRIKTYADKWDEIRDLSVKFDVTIHTAILIAKGILKIMEMDTECDKLTNEIHKCVSIDAHDEGDN